MATSTFTRTSVICDLCGNKANTNEKTASAARKVISKIKLQTCDGRHGYYPWAYVDGKDICGECLGKKKAAT
jgi:hypothetical protein